jgi:hypothetical protein
MVIAGLRVVIILCIWVKRVCGEAIVVAFSLFRLLDVVHDVSSTGALAIYSLIAAGCGGGSITHILMEGALVIELLYLWVVEFIRLLLLLGHLELRLVIELGVHWVLH